MLISALTKADWRVRCGTPSASSSQPPSSPSRALAWAAHRWFPKARLRPLPTRRWSRRRRRFITPATRLAASLTIDSCTALPENLAGCELRTSALLFELKGVLGDGTNKAKDRDKDKAFKECAACQALLDAFIRDTNHGKAAARAILKTDPTNETALFFLGKLDINYVWLQLGPLGRRTGWDEYWEARKSLDAVLKANPRHVRARVARGLDRLHRRHPHAERDTMDSRRRQPEARAGGGARSGRHRRGLLHQHRGQVRTVGHAGP